jgi:5-(carboxyamino)imidazole ribonucleotide synthase
MQKAFYSKNFKLGVLGGGQLGRMLLAPAIELDIKLAILDPDPEAPCSKLAHEFHCGDFRDYDTVLQFGESCDVLTVEIEHVNVAALRELQARGVKVFPQPDVLETVQDKGLQKEFYKKHGIPTAPFRMVAQGIDLRTHTDFLPFAQKLRTGGYDGRGVQLMRSEADFAKAFDAPCVLEKFVDFEKEIAIIAARNEAGEVKTFPVVELEFNPEANLVEFLLAPANISAEVAARAEAIARKTVEAYGLVGIMAIELFLLHNGEVLVNEVAPRPHNSGHHSIEANVTSQYAQHLRAILGMPLGDTATLRHAAMVNLLGAEGHNGPVQYEGLQSTLSLTEVYVHIYGKTLTKPFRKMGHVTATASSAAEARQKALQSKDLITVKSQ